MASIEEIRRKLLEKNEKKGGRFSSMDKAIYPFWNMETNSYVNLRFLQDGNPNNDYFWVSKEIIKIPFHGVKGKDEKTPVEVHVPCIEMWPDMGKCPIHEELRPWYKAGDPALEALASKYWKKRTYIFHGFVHNSPIKEDELSENPIRRLIIGPQLYNIIEQILIDPEVKDLPTDYERGFDLKVHKGKSGKNANYSASTWSRNTSPLTQEERDAIEKFGLPDLSTFLPKKPTQEEVGIMFDMFTASVNGELYDTERWGGFFKPKGVRFDDNEGTESSRQSGVAPVNTTVVHRQDGEVSDDVFAETEQEVVAPTISVSPPAASNTTGQTTDAILAMIRNREK